MSIIESDERFSEIALVSALSLPLSMSPTPQTNHVFLFFSTHTLSFFFQGQHALLLSVFYASPIFNRTVMGRYF